MTLQSQVCSLKLAKKLKGLGVKYESSFYWLVVEKLDRSSRFEKVYYKEYADRLCITADSGSTRFFAYTVAELGEMLTNTGYHSFHHSVGYWECFYLRERGNIAVFGNSHSIDLGCSRADTEADARAKMLIYLIENKLITL